MRCEAERLMKKVFLSVMTVLLSRASGAVTGRIFPVDAATPITRPAGAAAGMVQGADGLAASASRENVPGGVGTVNPARPVRPLRAARVTVH